ncbi:hypothetical protein PC116_g32319 [Phytophthora cactorum]|nr:hypothetical protein Pcac1_g17532 [Phytophthora cactorum]KAG4219201.1 hypothetical protein PC116_g32319 [Phytophthora cactorum]
MHGRGVDWHVQDDEASVVVASDLSLRRVDEAMVWPVNRASAVSETDVAVTTVSQDRAASPLTVGAVMATGLSKYSTLMSRSLP